MGNLKPDSEQAVGEEPKSDRVGNIAGGLMLFLGGALLYSLLVLLVSTFYHRAIYLPPTLYLALATGLLWAGRKTCSNWRLVLGCIWLCFCPLGVFNSFYFRHLEKSLALTLNWQRLDALEALSKASLIMAGVSLLAASVLLFLHRKRMNTRTEDLFALEEL